MAAAGAVANKAGKQLVGEWVEGDIDGPGGVKRAVSAAAESNPEVVSPNRLLRLEAGV